MKLRALLPALLLSLLTAACATAPDEADDIDSAASGAGEIVACDDAEQPLPYADLEQVYLDDEGFPFVEPIRLGDAAAIDPLVVTVDDGGLLVDPIRGGHALDTGALCACADEGCVVDWIDESLGCDVCAHVSCDGGEIGGCVPCETDDSPTASSCVFADATVSALE